MFVKSMLAVSLLIYSSCPMTTSAAVMRDGNRAVDLIEYPPTTIVVDCSILNDCGGNWECVEILRSLYKLDCFSGEASKKSSFGGDKRGGRSNLRQILIDSYLSRMG